MAVNNEELSNDEYRASSKFLTERLSNFGVDEVGLTIENLVEHWKFLQGRDYPPRIGESFKFYVNLTLTSRGQEKLMQLSGQSQEKEVGLFD